jgi:hypothetical protein
VCRWNRYAACCIRICLICLYLFLHRHRLLRLNITKDGGGVLVFYSSSKRAIISCQKEINKKRQIPYIKIFEQRRQVIRVCFQKAFCISQKLRSHLWCWH